MKKIPFIDNKCRRIELPANATFEDLVKLGVTNFDIVPEGTPLRDNWYKPDKTNFPCPSKTKSKN